MSSVTIASLPQDIARLMKSTGVWQEGCPVPLERLSLLRIPYVDFAGNRHDDGEMVALDVLCEAIASVFTALYLDRFPINKIRPLHDYAGNDESSMADNNTSCFCFRPIMGTSAVSVHSYGVALDINPLQNPYLIIDEQRGVVTSHPKDGWQFLNRGNKKTGMVEDLVTLFAEHGFFEWGGHWTSPVDYQHFQTPRGIAELLAALTPDDGKQLLKMSIQHRGKLSSMPHGQRLAPVLNLYSKNKSEFFDQWIDLALST